MKWASVNPTTWSLKHGMSSLHVIACLFGRRAHEKSFLKARIQLYVMGCEMGIACSERIYRCCAVCCAWWQCSHTRNVKNLRLWVMVK